MKLEEWRPSGPGDQLKGHYGRQGGDAVIQTDDGLTWMVPRGAEPYLKAIDPDVGQRVTVTYRGRDPEGKDVFHAIAEA
jgi:hypothetical protein